MGEPSSKSEGVEVEVELREFSSEVIVLTDSLSVEEHSESDS